MTSPIVAAAVERATVQVRLGPSAAARCRRRIHLDAASPGRRSEVSTAARRAFDDLAEHRESVFRAIRRALGSPAPESPQHGTSPAGRHADGPDRPVNGSADEPDRPVNGSADEPDRPVNGSADGPDRPAWRLHPAPIVLAPEMTTATRSGAADVLVWTGDGYAPVIVRAHRTRDHGVGALVSPMQQPLAVRRDPTHRVRRNRSDRLALAHHYRQLQALGCASGTARGGVIGLGSPTDGAGRRDTIGGEDDSSVIVWHDLDATSGSVLADYDLRFNDRFAVASAAATGDEPLAWPSRVAECRRCPWWPVCGAELLAAADISLLLSGADVAAARATGVETIPALADLGRSALAKLPLTVAQPGAAQIRARAWQRGAVLVRTGPRSAIPRADVEIDVDAESYGEDGAYLWGAQLSGSDVGLPQGYRSFVTWRHLPSPTQGEVFGEFFGYLMQVRAAAAARGLSFAAFCYAKAAEERWMLGLARRYAGLAGVPDAPEVAAFCASPQWVDLLQEIKRNFVATGSLRLKELARAIGFAWRDPEAGGENSMAWYRAAVGERTVGERTVGEQRAGERTPGDGFLSERTAVGGAVDGPAAGSAHPMAQRVIRYNEDDVLATLAVRRWITTHLDKLPTVADLESAPTP